MFAQQTPTGGPDTMFAQQTPTGGPDTNGSRVISEKPPTTQGTTLSKPQLEHPSLTFHSVRNSQKAQPSSALGPLNPP